MPFGLFRVKGFIRDLNTNMDSNLPISLKRMAPFHSGNIKEVSWSSFSKFKLFSLIIHKYIGLV